MAHNLNIVNGKASMAYTGDKPWHELGTHVDHAMTAAEALEASNLDWKVEKHPIFYRRPDTEEMVEVEGKNAIVRMDTYQALGVVGKRYHPLQNGEALSLFDAIVGEKLAVYHTIGALGKGEKIWLLAKLPGSVWITPEDNIDKYVMLTNSHDGSSAIQITVTPIRVVCQNTLNIALESTTDRMSKVRHTMNLGKGIEEIRDQLGMVNRYYRLFQEAGQFLVAKQATTNLIEEVFSNLGLSKDKASESTRTKNIRNDILERFEKGMGNDLPTIKGSIWAFINGLSEHVDYGRGSDRGRTKSILFGSGLNMKQRAFDKVLELVK